MLIEILDSNRLVVGCDDRALLETMKEHMGGKKIFRVNKISIPLRSGTKIYRFKKYGIKWGKGAKKLVDQVVANTIKRRDIIKKIKEQYGDVIKFEYDCKGIYDPLEHQKIMYNCIAYPDVSAVIADCGTCKTGPYLWAIDKRINTGQVKKALVITMSDLKENVLGEMKKQVPHMTGVILKSKAQADKVINKTYTVKKRNIDYDIYIGNYEQMFGVLAITPDDYFDMVVLDEAHRIGSPGSRQTKEIVKKFEFCKYKCALTGTLTANNLMSFYMPYRFLGPDTVPYAKYWSFRQELMHTVDPDGHIWKPNHGSVEKVAKIIGSISVRFRKEECLEDLPPLIREVNSCDMAPGQRKLYTEMKTDLVTMIDDMCDMCDQKGKCNMCCSSTVTANNALVLTGKLRQIASGFYINTRTSLNEDGKEIKQRNVIYLNENPKLRLLIQTLNNISLDKKVIIWSTYVPAISLIKKSIGDAFGPDRVLTCYQKDNAFEQIQKFKDDQYNWLVGNPTKMGHGHNIQFSNYSVFFNNSYSYVHKDQAEGRQYRQGQENSVTVIELAARKTIDELILKAIEKKVDLSLTLSQWSRVLKKPDSFKI